MMVLIFLFTRRIRHRNRNQNTGIGSIFVTDGRWRDAMTNGQYTHGHFPTNPAAPSIRLGSRL